jgi:hypothetical protein
VGGESRLNHSPHHGDMLGKWLCGRFRAAVGPAENGLRICERGFSGKKLRSLLMASLPLPVV